MSVTTVKTSQFALDGDLIVVTIQIQRGDRLYESKRECNKSDYVNGEGAIDEDKMSKLMVAHQTALRNKIESGYAVPLSN